MKIGDLVRVKSGIGLYREGQLCLIIAQDGNELWFDVQFLNGEKGALMKKNLEVTSENR